MINNYGELKAQIALWMNRTDLASMIPYFVRLAEQDIYRGLECEDNQFIAHYTSTGWYIEGHGTNPVSDGIFQEMPPNFRRMSLVTWNGKPLKNVSRQALAENSQHRVSDQVREFAISARGIVFYGGIDSDPGNWLDTDELVYIYYGTESLDSMPTWQVDTNPVENPPVEDNSPEVISQSDQNTTRMLQRNPEMYLHGSLYYAGLYLQDDEMAAKFSSLFSGAMTGLRLESKRDKLSGSTLQVSGVN